MLSEVVGVSWAGEGGSQGSVERDLIEDWRLRRVGAEVCCGRALDDEQEGSKCLL